MISFVEPIALLALLVVPLLWLPLLARGAARRPSWREQASVAVRSVAVGALALALAGAQLRLPSETLTVMFVLDTSRSILPEQRQRAEEYLRAAVAGMPHGQQAGLVVFGGGALVARLPSAERTLSAIPDAPGVDHTGIAEAIRLGLALIPREGQGRLVLLSDGGETSGDAIQAARLAAARAVPLEVIPLVASAPGDDARIAGVSIPPRLREGTRPRLSVATESSRTASARLTVFDNGRPVAEQTVALPVGRGSVEVELPEPEPGYNRYEVRLEAADDSRPENNRAQAFSIVEGKPRVLLVEGQAGEAAALSAALDAARVQTETIAPAALPDSMDGLAGYDAVLLVNVARQALPPLAAGLLPAYVHDLGRGLAMIGGPNSFGAGGYGGSPIEAALPVRMDLPPRIEIPEVATVVLIDISGSMALTEEGVQKVQLAAAGAARIAAHMQDRDELTVIPFDSVPHNIIGPLPGSQRDRIMELLRGVQTEGGGIAIYDGLATARGFLERANKPIRHLITITDGNDTVQREGSAELVDQLRAQNITVTTIAIGNGDAVTFLEDLARRGGGRAFLTEKAGQVPEIILDDMRQIIRPYLVEGAVAPLLTAPGGAERGLLRGIDTPPPLAGYVATVPQPRAEVLLSSPAGDPLLATWQYGLGRSLAWTSDLTARWASGWLGWEQFPQLASQLVAWIAPPPGSQRMAVETRTDGASLHLTATLGDGQRPASGMRVAGSVVGSDGARHPVELREVQPGRYQALAGDLPPDVYQVQLSASRPDGTAFAALMDGAVVASDAEFSTPASPQLLQTLAQLTGGRVGPPPAALFDPTGAAGGTPRPLAMQLLWLGLALLPLELALRRWPFARADLARLRPALQRRLARLPRLAALRLRRLMR
ncbi:MAG TPA: VWA domain-containing protein [Roseiflexaceae bacterium]|nr:VWA domain-containing protein [Roseiflexaceae bacterium]